MGLMKGFAAGGLLGGYLGYQDTGSIGGTLGGAVAGGLGGLAAGGIAGKGANWLGRGKGFAGLGQRGLGMARGFGLTGAAKSQVAKNMGASGWDDLVKMFPNRGDRVDLINQVRRGRRSLRGAGWRGQVGDASQWIGNNAADINKVGAWAFGALGASSAAHMGASLSSNRAY